MTSNLEVETRQQVREFYDRVGWHFTDADMFQNAHYEDLRPVSRQYVQDCHLRVRRFLPAAGKYLLDAGSGPVQYPEYLIYSEDYRFRVCVDISIVALQEARRRVGVKGLFAVADIMNLPFKRNIFDGVVSLHTIHHLPLEHHRQAYGELYRVLKPAGSAVVVNAWNAPRLIHAIDRTVRFINRTRKKWYRARSGEAAPGGGKHTSSTVSPKGTFVSHADAAWLKRELTGFIPFEIHVWRSVSVRFLRTFIHDRLAGRWLLQQLFQLEERYPRFFGENGQYPMIIIRKPKL